MRARNFIADSYLPWRAGRDLLAGDETIGQLSMNARRVHTENLRCFPNRNQFAARQLSRRLESRNVAIEPQAADLVRGEAFFHRCSRDDVHRDKG